MGAQAAHMRHHEDGELPKEGTTDSVVEEESESPESLKEVAMPKSSQLHRKTSAGAPDQLAELEEQLVVEKRRCRMQEEELDRMRALVEQLEKMVDRQASATESEHERIAMLEQSIGQQQNGTEEKVAKLLLAVAGEKRRADMAEQEHVDLERQHQAVVEELRQQLEAARGTSSSTAIDEPENQDDLKKEFQAERALRLEMEQQYAGIELQVKTLQQEVVKLTNEAAERQEADIDKNAVGENTETKTIAEVTGQYQSEMAKRMDAQNKLLQKDQQVRELQRQVDTMRDATVPTSVAPGCEQDRQAAQEAKKLRRELAEKESQLRELQQQLADELTKRAQLQGQVVEKDKQLRETQFILEDSDLYRHHAAQEQLLQKTRELCDLQAQLTQELALRQSVQYKVIEKERIICDLQKQLMNARGTHESSSTTERSSSFVRSSTGPRGPPVGGVEDGSSYDFEGEGCASPREPEGEDSTCQTGADSPPVQQVGSVPISGFGPPIPLGEQPSMMPSVQNTPLGSLRTPAGVDSTAFMVGSVPISGFGPPIPLGEQPSMMPSVQNTPLGSLRTPAGVDSTAFMSTELQQGVMANQNSHNAVYLFYQYQHAGGCGARHASKPTQHSLVG
eukprot:CAMPEP_0172929486 /NCGR_PEP_ID=MMETSP1075-20121228/218507_1 /TAXON_ID=2916 /ORGANISM="Ceratium fusus, Strain PA161109" /LENGTH=620 /DNA_ID=CAMNT_0013790781 /DNA_START=39 /DNA_END=1900 /DNA_ORIENTATION=+